MWRLTGVLAILVLSLVLGGCGGGTAPLVASFTRGWDDGRIETLEVHEDGRANHNGTLDRVTLADGDVRRLAASLADIAPAADPQAYPRLTLTPAGGKPVVVDTSPGSAGALFLSLLDRLRLP